MKYDLTVTNELGGHSHVVFYDPRLPKKVTELFSQIHSHTALLRQSHQQINGYSAQIQEAQVLEANGQAQPGTVQQLVNEYKQQAEQVAQFEQQLQQAVEYYEELLSEQQYSFVTEADNHQPRIYIEEPTIQGETILPASWEVVDPSGLIHSILPEYPVKEVKPPETDDKEIVSMVQRSFSHVYERNRENRRKAYESEGFYSGDSQWVDLETGEDLDQVEDGRARLVKNKIEPAIDELLGIQRQSRGSIKFLPTNGGSQIGSDIINILCMHVTDRSQFAYEESEAFESIAIVGKSYFQPIVDTSEDVRGEILIKHFPWYEAEFSEHSQYDGTDAGLCVKWKWMSIEEAKGRYYKKRDLLENYLSYMSDSVGNKYDNEEYLTHSVEHENKLDIDNMSLAMSTEYVDIANKNVRVIQLYKTIYLPAAVGVYVGAENPETFNLYGWRSKHISQLNKVNSFEVFERAEPHVRHTTIAGGVLLEDEYPADLPGRRYPLIPIYAKKKHDKWWGKVENVKSSQQEYNKRHSQFMDLVNRMLSSIYYVYPDTFPGGVDGSEARRFRENASTPGYVALIENRDSKPDKEESFRFPVELVTLADMNKDDIREGLNISVPTPEQVAGGPDISFRLNRIMIGNEYLFDNLRRSKKQLYTLLVQYIQKYYDTDRIIEILRNQSLKDPDVRIDGKEVNEYSDEDITSLLKDEDFTKYEVVVAETVHTQTMRIATLMLLTELRKQGTEVPLESIVEYSELPETEKQKLIANYQQQQQVSMEAQNKVQQTELLKSVLGDGVIPAQIETAYVMKEIAPSLGMGEEEIRQVMEMTGDRTNQEF